MILKVMGCRLSLFKQQPDMASCLQKLDEAESLLEKMAEKYGRQEASLDESLRRSLKMKSLQSKNLHLLRRKKVVQHYINACHARMNNIYSKRMALEQLNLNQTQLKAMRAAANAFSNFSKNNSVEKIEELQDNMASTFDELMEVDTVLSEPLLNFDDSELLEELSRAQELSRSQELSSFDQEAPPASFPTSPQRYPSLDDEQAPLIVSSKLPETPVAVQ